MGPNHFNNKLLKYDLKNWPLHFLHHILKINKMHFGIISFSTPHCRIPLIQMATFPPKTPKEEASQFTRQELMRMPPTPHLYEGNTPSGAQKL